MKRIIAPSVLSADFGNLNRDMEMLQRSQAEWVHVDVMDGVFVPNISFGFPLMKPLRKGTTKVLDVHLMITAPEKYVTRFVEAGADYVSARRVLRWVSLSSQALSPRYWTSGSHSSTSSSL